jgi:hypothetical protein
MRRRLPGLQLERRPLLKVRDYVEALAVFAFVVLATFPSPCPFLMTIDPATALHRCRRSPSSCCFSRDSRSDATRVTRDRFLPGLAMAVFGVVLIAAVKALGG